MPSKATRETLAAIGVIGSMIFVGLEIRQNTQAVRANAIQESTTSAATGPFGGTPGLPRRRLSLDRTDCILFLFRIQGRSDSIA